MRIDLSTNSLQNQWLHNDLATIRSRPVDRIPGTPSHHRLRPIARQKRGCNHHAEDSTGRRQDGGESKDEGESAIRCNYRRYSLPA